MAHSCFYALTFHRICCKSTDKAHIMSFLLFYLFVPEKIFKFANVKCGLLKAKPLDRLTWKTDS